MKDLFSSSLFPKEWTYSVLKLLDWIRDYRYFSSQRNAQFPYENSNGKGYAEIEVISGTHVNPSNPANSKLVLEIYNENGKRYIDTTGGKVINVTQYPCNDPAMLSQCYKIKPVDYKLVATRVFSFITLCKNWLDITDSEFILDPDHYLII